MMTDEPVRLKVRFAFENGRLVVITFENEAQITDAFTAIEAARNTGKTHARFLASNGWRDLMVDYFDAMQGSWRD